MRFCVGYQFSTTCRKLYNSGHSLKSYKQIKCKTSSNAIPTKCVGLFFFKKYWLKQGVTVEHLTPTLRCNRVRENIRCERDIGMGAIRRSFEYECAYHSYQNKLPQKKKQ